MDLLTALRISASGLSAQRTRLNVLSSNLANANSTKDVDGVGPYKRKDAIFREVTLDNFEKVLDREYRNISAVEIENIQEDLRPGQLIYDPAHPDANAEGYVEMPNVNVVTELTDIMATSRAYEANVTAMRASKEMVSAALSIGRN